MHVIVLTALGVGSAEANAQTDWDVVLNGRSIHVSAAQKWNEENWGLGVEREFNSSGRWVKVALASGFKDSMGEPSYMAGGSIKRRFRVAADDLYVDLGLVGFMMTREDVNKNHAFPGVLPAMTVGNRRVAVNFTYLPNSVVDRVTNAHLADPQMNGVLFIQIKFDSSLFGFGRERPVFADSSSE